MTKQENRAPQQVGVRLERLAIVLNRPQLPENIGAVARAACNTGIKRLILVQPESVDWERMRMMSTGAAAHLLKSMTIYDDLATALAPFSYVVGTTARLGGIRKEVFTPRDIAQRLIELSPHNDIALLFGPENWGLTNKELPLCHALVTIPTADCSSLNLAQAVMVVGYEIFVASATNPRFEPRWANSRELASMYAMLQETLVKINFISHQNPEYWMLKVRRLFNRHGLKAQETQVIKGICRQIDWYVKKELATARMEKAGKAAGE